MKLQGIVVPMITPLTGAGMLDYAGLEKLTNHLIDGGCAALFGLGTTGEGPFLSSAMQEEVIRQLCAFSGKRRPVLAGIASASPEDSILLGRKAADSGAAGVVVAPPCYLPMTDDELFDFYSLIAAKVNLPVYIYNMPGMTKITLKPALMNRLAAIPGVAGYKDSSNDMNSLHEVLRDLAGKPDFSIFVGPDSLMAETVMLGGDGGVNSGANLYPEIYVSCFKAMQAGNLPEVMRFQKKIDTLQKIYKVYQPSGNAVAMGLKTGLKLKGICGNSMKFPLMQPDSGKEALIRRIMDEIEAI